MSRVPQKKKSSIKAAQRPELLTEEQLKGIFKRYDKNNDGRLSKRELNAAFEALGSYLPQWRAWRGICNADVNGDGLISEKELDRLAQYALQFGYTAN